MDDIAPQLSDKQIEDLKAVIYMAKETGEPQLAFNSLGLKLMVFLSGLLTKKYDDMEGYKYKMNIAEARKREANRDEM